MRKIASILLGSGFSIPERLPSVKDLNRRLAKISSDEVYIHSDMQAFFINEEQNTAFRVRSDEHTFIQYFLEFYNSRILRTDEAFDYERFYDFFSLYLNNNANASEIDTFCQEFEEKHEFRNSTDLHNSSYNRISSFRRSFNQLLAQQLHKPEYFNESTTSSFGNHGGFWVYLRELLKSHDIKVHSLNHDLFFEWVGNSHPDFFSHFSDGFEYPGSPFYGTLYEKKNIGGIDIHKEYKVKLAYFSGRFNTPLSLYKLHGSIFNHIVYTDDQKRVRVRKDYGVDRLFMEAKDLSTGNYSFVGVLDEVDPDFLSGSTNKMIYYSGDSFYKSLLDHFEKNLLASESLLVIGYGFNDQGINEYLEKYYLKQGKKMIIIDPGNPNPDFLNSYNAELIQQDINKVSYEIFEQLLAK